MLKPLWKKRRLQHRCFPVNIAKFLKTAFFEKHLRWLLLASKNISRFAKIVKLFILDVCRNLGYASANCPPLFQWFPPVFCSYRKMESIKIKWVNDTIMGYRCLYNNNIFWGIAKKLVKTSWHKFASNILICKKDIRDRLQSYLKFRKINLPVLISQFSNIFRGNRK